MYPSVEIQYQITYKLVLPLVELTVSVHTLESDVTIYKRDNSSTYCTDWYDFSVHRMFMLSTDFSFFWFSLAVQLSPLNDWNSDLEEGVGHGTKGLTPSYAVPRGRNLFRWQVYGQTTNSMGLNKENVNLNIIVHLNRKVFARLRSSLSRH